MVTCSEKEQSQPSWVAWIEIAPYERTMQDVKSQPSWAAWIEIVIVPDCMPTVTVAALLGCVD